MYWWDSLNALQTRLKQNFSKFYAALKVLNKLICFKCMKKKMNKKEKISTTSGSHVLLCYEKASIIILGKKINKTNIFIKVMEYRSHY